MPHLREELGRRYLDRIKAGMDYINSVRGWKGNSSDQHTDADDLLLVHGITPNGNRARREPFSRADFEKDM